MTLQTTPFNLIDEFAHLAERLGGFMSGQWEVRVAGHLDAAQVRDAMHAAAQRHPMARARMMPSKLRDATWQWEIRPGLDVDPVIEHPLGGDHGVRSARHEALHCRVPLRASPPIRVWLVHHDAGDVLNFAVSHAPLDGPSFRRFLISMARHLSGEDDPGDPVDPLAVRDIAALLGLHDVSAREGMRAILRLARDPAGPPTRLAKDGAVHRRGVGSTMRTIARQRALAPDLRLTEVLIAAYHHAIDLWNCRHGQATGRISTYVPINIRPPEWRDDVVGNFSLAGSVTTTAEDRDDVKSLTAAVAERVTRVRDRSAVNELAPAMFAMGRLPLWVRRGAPLIQPLAGRTLDTSVVVNIGRFDGIDFGGDAGPITEAWVGGAIRMPLGAGVAVSAVGDRLLIGLRHEWRQFSPSAAERFLDTFTEAIDQVVASRREGP